jgi:hypothetical protein
MNYDRKLSLKWKSGYSLPTSAGESKILNFETYCQCDVCVNGVTVLLHRL